MSNFPIEFKCRNCGGKLDVTPETLMIICSYCGTLNWFINSSEEIMAVYSVGRDEILKSFLTRISEDPDLKRIVDKIQIVEVSGIYIPFYFFSIKIEGFYEGYVIERVVRASGKKTRVEYRRKKVSDKFSSIMRIPVLGRRSAEDFSIKELTSHYLYSNPKLIPINDLDVKNLKMNFLRSEINSEEASIIARDNAGDSMRSKISSKVTELIRFTCNTKILNKSPLILLPYWYIVYSYGGAQYKVAYAGWDKFLLLAQEPIMFYHRLGYLAGGLTGCLISTLTLTLTLGRLDPFFSIIGLATGCFLSYFFSEKLVSDVRIEK